MQIVPNLTSMQAYFQCDEFLQKDALLSIHAQMHRILIALKETLLESSTQNSEPTLFQKPISAVLHLESKNDVLPCWFALQAEIAEQPTGYVAIAFNKGLSQRFDPLGEIHPLHGPRGN